VIPGWARRWRYTLTAVAFTVAVAWLLALLDRPWWSYLLAVGYAGAGVYGAGRQRRLSGGRRPTPPDAEAAERVPCPPECRIRVAHEHHRLEVTH
jgi:hypothetical protein